MLKNIRGLKYPEEYLVRFFFKEQLNKNEPASKVLELGCGNGNNLMLFSEFNWRVYGVDINKKIIRDAKFNFKKSKKKHYKFECQDMLKFTKKTINDKFDCLLLPSSLYYLPEKKIFKLFELIKKRKILNKNCFVYFRIRLINDYRSKKGKKINNKTYKLKFNETMEFNMINTFFKENDFVKLLKKNFDFLYLKKMKINFDNYNKNFLIDNKDLIVWGKLK